MSVYDATYAAVRTCLSNCDVGAAVQEVLRANCDFSWVTQQAQNAITFVEREMTRPSVLFKPTLSHDIDAGVWLSIYGHCVGRGVSPDEAVCDFDRKWVEKLKPR